jgi:hypothetical protein
MFNLSAEDRLSSWADHRHHLENCEDPLTETFEFWKESPYIPYNNKIDPYNYRSWPTPWEIIVYNKYDDFTRTVMMAYSIKYTQRFEECLIEIRTLVDNKRSACYNIVCVDNEWAINYNDIGIIHMEEIPETFLVENLIEVGHPR